MKSQSTFSSMARTRTSMAFFALIFASCCIAPSFCFAVTSQSSPVKSSRPVNFKRAWYPLAIIKDLQVDRPTRAFLLGSPVVLWKGDDAFVAFDDRCPHRLAPLSEGRIHTDPDQQCRQLQCAYHGWGFAQSGDCKTVPQAETSHAAESKRACATVLPTREVQGLLWVWPDASPDGLVASTDPDNAPALVPDMSDPGFGGFWYMRDLPYSYETLIENLGDPCHLNFAHHGVIGRRERAMPLDIKVDTNKNGRFGKAGYKSEKFAFIKVMREDPNMEVGFQEPSLVYYRSDFTDGLGRLLNVLPLPMRVLGKMYQKFLKVPEKGLLSYFVGYAVPTSPGHCRIILRNSRNFLQFLGRKKLVEAHLGQHLVLDGDTILLHEEERLIRMKQAESGHSDWDRLFYLPTASDAPVRAFRHWLSAATDNGEGPTNTVDWAPGVSRELPPLERNRAVLLDRLNSHTLQCSECRKGLEDAIFAKKLSFSLACVFVATSAALSSIRMSSAAAGLALICAANGYRQMKQQQRFVFEDYVHASRDS